MTFLSARALSGGYGRGTIVHEVDFQVGAGECVALMGPNGAGKSTLLRLLAGILPVRSGVVELDGQSLAAWRRRDVARTIGFVPQLVNLAFPVTVHELVEQGRAPHLGPWRPPTRRDHEIVDAAIARVGLVGSRQASVASLSGGERQRVLLARALASEPRLLLLDEPAAALDIRHQLDLVEIVRTLAGSGVGIVLIAHDWQLALRVADRLVVIHHGRVWAAGTPGEILSARLFREVFGVDAEFLSGPDGLPVVVPRLVSGDTGLDPVAAP